MAQPTKSENPTESENRAKVLLVDDMYDNRVLISSILKKIGVKVDCAENGKEAMEKALLGDYDVILMDLQMPVMDGYQATTALRQHGFAKPIVAITAHSLNEHREKSLQSGFTAHVTKPVCWQTLCSCLSALCPKINHTF
ncbi:MAG TPA: response regulator [Oligoflexus sp.]|uniref:response regulator n=1 Tax=Oligoflexus sp. TaxID=1971216 RepID=UPI002D35DB84|nr:response regulator [Oligoflexus sp.]HYX38526.1 response regulator [Oligoflexus sp.]